MAERLKELTIDEYSETLIDKDDGNPPQLFVFGKDIHHRQIYIKLKIKGNSEATRSVCILSLFREKNELPV